MSKKELLEQQADAIEDVLKKHGIPPGGITKDGKLRWVTGGTVTPRWVRFKVVPGFGAKISQIKGLKEEFAAALGVDNCRVQRRGAAVDVEVAHDDAQPVRLLALYHQLIESDVALQNGVPPMTAILGLADDGAPLLIRLPSPDVEHILVAGERGAGKTNLLQAIALSLALENDPSDLNLFLLSKGKGMEIFSPLGEKIHTTALADSSLFQCFQGLGHLLQPPIQDLDEKAILINDLRKKTWHQDRDGHTVVIIDDLDRILNRKPCLYHPLTTAMHRENFHLIASVADPTRSTVRPLVAFFPVRLVGKVTSATDARAASGWSGTGAERLDGRGDFIAVAEGRMMRFQGAHVEPQEISKAVAKINSPGIDVGTIEPEQPQPPGSIGALAFQGR